MSDSANASLYQRIQEACHPYTWPVILIPRNTGSLPSLYLTCHLYTKKYRKPVILIPNLSFLYLTCHPYTWPVILIPRNTGSLSSLYLTSHSYAWPVILIPDLSSLYLTCHPYTWPVILIPWPVILIPALSSLYQKIEEVSKQFIFNFTDCDVIMAMQYPCCDE